MSEPTSENPSEGDLPSDASAVGSEETQERPEQASRRERSTIRFPYTDIREAVKVAEAWTSKLGSVATLDQLAGALDQSQSGAFRTRLATAVIFGVIENKRGQLNLTPLGARIADPALRADALVESFMGVPLYKAIYTAFRGRSLPGDKGLESDMIREGVTPNQVDRARQAMMRSADAAGLFWSGKDRLVLPPNATMGNGSGEPLDPPARGKSGDSEGSAVATGGGDTKMSDAPLLKALWDTLPAGKDFSTEQRKRFFTALAFNIDYVYGPPSDGGTLNPEGVANLWTSNSP